ncbi:MAG: hypothetical protein BWX80_02969 [Candidatus Hydrogenedentes bacterium ADurb.Bin101]|jgi:predicted acyltransferase|nr:MAG: hypothetical protein BWX80_02969 [Candidatus Hydrogenedentes bacterium ADurb.Bin101]HOC67918.1 DUF5009 domain-containing protein [Candidatus Hydrogenedentota bacterium]
MASQSIEDTPAGKEEALLSPPVPPEKAPRLMSLDVLRGFDMFWIVGGKEVFSALVALLCLSGGVPDWLEYHLNHPAWTGFSAWDLIMPLFLFVSGASIPFALALKAGERRDYAAVYRRLIRRVVLLWIFGMIAQGNLLEMDPDRLRFFSNTLQAIAVGYAITVVAFIHTSLRWQVVLCAGLLATYWLLMMFVPVPGAGRWALEPDCNLALWLDDLILGRFRDGTTYAWILPGLGFGASVLLGSFAGRMLRAPWTPRRRVAALAVSGAACLFAGWLWGLHFPIIKHLWTSSMVLWAGGWSFLLLAFFYLVVDIADWKRWAYPFMVIGANAITAYMLVHIIDFEALLKNLAFLKGGSEGVLMIAAALAFLLLWLFLWFLYKRKIFLRV